MLRKMRSLSASKPANSATLLRAGETADEPDLQGERDRHEADEAPKRPAHAIDEVRDRKRDGDQHQRGAAEDHLHEPLLHEVEVATHADAFALEGFSGRFGILIFLASEPS